jgi:hypothetical protein
VWVNVVKVPVFTRQEEDAKKERDEAIEALKSATQVLFDARCFKQAITINNSTVVFDLKRN